MVSTYLSYDLVVRDLKSSMSRTANETQVKRDSEYYKEHIGKVKTLDEFLGDYRLYSFAMKAYGLEDMIYAKAFMKKVLESDLSDANSYANKLTDTRYKQFAAAYQFGSGTKVPQSESQTDELIGLYTARIESADDRITGETNYYKGMQGRITNVDQFLSDPRLRAYMFTAYGINQNTYDRALIRNLLVSNVEDQNSYFNTVILPKVVEATDVINGNQAVLDKIKKRTNYSNDITALQLSIVDVNAKRAEIAQLEIDKTAPGADIAVIQKSIDEKQTVIERAFAHYVDGVVSDLTADIANLEAQKTQAGADIPALQAQIDAKNAQLTDWKADATIRTQIASKRTDIATLEASKSAAGADIPAIQAQIDAKRAEIATLQGGLKPVDIADLQQTITQRQAAVDALNLELPAVGDATKALVAQMSAANTKAATYLSAAAGYEKIVSAYAFNADGSVPASGFQSAEKLQETTSNYVFKQERLTRAGAMMNDEYFRSKINTFTKASDVMADARIVAYLKAAFGLSSYTAVVNSTIENAMTTPNTDEALKDPENYLTKFYSKRPYYNNLIALSRAFNFNTDGTLPAGKLPIDTSKLPSVSGGYFSGYDDAAEEADQKAITNLKAALNSFKTDEGKISNVDELVGNKAVYEFAMKAVDLDSTQISKRTMKKVLASDLQDPRSYVYSLKDDRYVQFAKLFNFDKDGKLTWARMAQSEDTLTQTAKDYIIQKTRFADKKEKEKIKTAAEKDSKYYQEKIASIDTRKEFLADRKLIDFVLTAKGIDPKNVTTDYMKKIFESDLKDAKSFANTEKDYRFAEIAASFNFDKSGNVIRVASDAIQQEGEVMHTMNLYLRQAIETTQGEENNGVRLALYFERMAPAITSAYDILGDTALLEFFRTTYSLPQEISSMKVDQQAKLVEKHMTLKDLKDPEKLKKMINRFTVMYDLQSDTSTSPAVALMSGGSGTISADLMLSISQLRRA